jgi:hypothetical protein
MLLKAFFHRLLMTFSDRVEKKSFSFDYMFEKKGWRITFVAS